MALPNPSMDFTAFDVLAAAQLDDLIENIQSLADGTGFLANAIPGSAIKLGAITPALLQDALAIVGTGGVVAIPANTAKIVVTGLDAAVAIGAPAGTPKDMQTLTMKLKDTGTAQAIAFNTVFVPLGVTLPTTTVAGKWLYVTSMYDAASSKWHVLSVGRQA